MLLTVQGETVFFPVERVVYPGSNHFLNEKLLVSRHPPLCIARLQKSTGEGGPTWGLEPWMD